MLTNPFYSGLIHIDRTNETYQGIHEAILPKSVFDRVQDVLHGKVNTRAIKHDFLFRRRLTCHLCGYTLIGETHRSNVYYRCQTPECPTTCLREEDVEAVFLRTFSDLRFADDERRYFWDEVRKLKSDDRQNQEKTISALQLQLSQMGERLNRLTDAYIDRLIDKDLFEQRKNALLGERVGTEEKLKQWQGGKKPLSELLAEILEHSETAYLTYKLRQASEKRDLVDSLTSNRTVSGKTLTVMLNSPFDAVAGRSKTADGSPSRSIPRTWKLLSRQISKCVQLENESQLATAA